MATHPHNTPSGVNDTGLPSRRRIGAMLAAGAAMALPSLPAIAASVEPDADLIGLADELDYLERRSNALIAAHPGLDYDQMPGHDELEERRWAVLVALATTKAASLKGCAAKARALGTEGVQGDGETYAAIGDSLADDVLSFTA